MSADVETMMYAKATPWHGEGTYVGDEAVDAATAITAAGLGWGVELRPVYQLVPEDLGAVSIDFHREIPNVKSVTRDSDHKSLGIVSDRYVPVQNTQAFGFMDSLVGGSGLRYQTAGALAGGRKVWLLAELTADHFEVTPGDEVIPYLLLSNSHDGSGALRVKFTTVRVVCQNTLSMALRSRGGVSITHTGDVVSKLRAAEHVLGLARKEVAAHAEWTQILAATTMSADDWTGFLDALLPVPDDRDPARVLGKRSLLDELLEDAPGADTAPGTWWAGLNAVTNYTTHHATVRGANGPDGGARKLDALWYGAGDKMNRAAVQKIRQLVPA